MELVAVVVSCCCMFPVAICLAFPVLSTERSLDKELRLELDETTKRYKLLVAFICSQRSYYTKA